MGDLQGQDRMDVGSGRRRLTDYTEECRIECEKDLVSVSNRRIWLA